VSGTLDFVQSMYSMFRHQSSTSSYQAYDIVLFGFAISYVLCLGACEIVDLFGTLHEL